MQTTERIIDISDQPARLHVRYENLVIERADDPPVSLPIRELAVLVVSHPQVSFSHAVISGIASNGGAFITCDQSRLPVAMLLPIQANYIQTRRFLQQANASEPTRKRLWQQIVKAKIAAQAKVLSAHNHGDDDGLAALVPRVASGDSKNTEGRAARRYWPLLFNNPRFRRNPFRKDQNRHLNYGYAVLRAIVSRAVCAAGLHPSIGIHHHNQYNPFCLADDLMEPFRPHVDSAVARWIRDNGADCDLDRHARAFLISSVSGRFKIGREFRSLFDIASRLASSLVSVFEAKRRKLYLPEL